MPEAVPSGFEALATSRAYFTQESMLAIDTRRRKLFIGLPRESSLQENRICLTPEAVKHLVDGGTRGRDGERGRRAQQVLRPQTTRRPAPPSPTPKRRSTRPTSS